MFSKLNKFFSSVKLAIVLLISIAVLSMAGTFINQGETAAQYRAAFGPEAFKILYRLGLLDVYGSWYFTGLALLLMGNLVVASVNAFPFAFRAIFGPYPSFQESFDKKSPKALYETIKSKKTAAEISSVLNNVFGSPLKETAKTGGGTEAYYSKNSIFRISPYIAHISVLIILAGVLLNVKYGFRSYANIKVGEKTNIAYLQKNNKPVKLPFYIRLDKYETKYYYPPNIPNQEILDLILFLKYGEYKSILQPSSYISKLTMINNKHISVLTKYISVNHPLTYDGITMYQSSYGHYKPTAFRFMAVDLNNKKFKKLIELTPGEPYTPGKIPQFKGLSFEIIPAGAAGNQKPYMAVYNNGKTGGMLTQKVIFNIVSVKKKGRNIPLVFARYKNIAFIYAGIVSYYYSGLQITRNSYTSVIWAGSIMLIISLFFSFFFNQREIWVRFLPEKEGKGTVVEILAVPQKKFESFYRTFNKKIAKIKNGLK